MSSNTEANIAATKYARFETGYLPADDDRYVAAFTHFKAGYSSRDKEVEDLKSELSTYKETCESVGADNLRVYKEVEKLKEENQLLRTNYERFKEAQRIIDDQR